jgi:hypothetical protein
MSNGDNYGVSCKESGSSRMSLQGPAKSNRPFDNLSASSRKSPGRVEKTAIKRRDAGYYCVHEVWQPFHLDVMVTVGIVKTD